MARERDITAVVRETQERIFRICQARGLTLKAISLDSGIPYNSLRSYAGNNGSTAVMGVDTLAALVGVVPDELLSLLLPGRAIVRAPEELDHDDFERLVRDYLGAKAEAHHPDSPAGREISACERERLDGKAAGLRLVA